MFGSSRRPTPAPQGRRRPALRVAALAAAGALLAAGCGGAGGHQHDHAAVDKPPVMINSGPASPFKATTLGTPITKPALALTDANGAPYDFRQRTAGKVTLLFFGFTHCPDVCPTTMADIATALRSLPEADRNKVEVVMVSTDPERDTPAVLRQWLDSFDKSFVGLTGPFDQVQKAAKDSGVPVPEPTVHGSQVLAFGLDNQARMVFLSGATPDDYAHDLPLLIKGSSGTA